MLIYFSYSLIRFYFIFTYSFSEALSFFTWIQVSEQYHFPSLWWTFLFLAEFYGFINTNTMCTQAVYSFSSLCSLALGLVTLMARWAALSTMALWFFEESEQSQHSKICCTSAQAPWPSRPGTSGSLCFVFLLLPDQCQASQSGPWIFCTSYCQCLRVSTRYA